MNDLIITRLILVLSNIIPRLPFALLKRSNASFQTIRSKYNRECYLLEATKWLLFLGYSTNQIPTHHIVININRT